MWGTNMQSNNRHTNDARFVIKTLKAYVCFYLFRKSIMLGFFLNFCKNYCQNAQRKGKWYFFPYYFRKCVYFERSIDFELFSLRVPFMLAESYQVVINLALPSWTHRCSRFWFCH